MTYRIIWGDLARNQLKEACSFIKRDSLANSEKVRKGIIAASRSLALHPKKHPADKHKINNDGSYRVFILYRYRLSYKIQGSDITILRMRHTSMEPLEY